MGTPKVLLFSNFVKMKLAEAKDALAMVHTLGDEFAAEIAQLRKIEVSRPQWGKFLDLQMLIFPGGKERTEKQFRELFAAGGWKLSRVVPTVTPICIVEGIPA